MESEVLTTTTISIDQVQAFWNSNPLFTGESNFERGSKDFFAHHRSTVFGEYFARQISKPLFPKIRDSSILDLGCEVGFWL
jgi:hypothetical protein